MYWWVSGFWRDDSEGVISSRHEQTALNSEAVSYYGSISKHSLWQKLSKILETKDTNYSSKQNSFPTFPNSITSLVSTG